MSPVGNPMRRNWKVEAKWIKDRASDLRKMYLECDDTEVVERLMRLEKLLLAHAEEVSTPVKYGEKS